MTSLHQRSGGSLVHRRIGLLGGSFNPAHDGHRAISLYALKHLSLDEVWWLVSPQNPLKSSQDMAPLAVRLTTARARARHRKIIVTDIESALGTRYSIDTLKSIKQCFPRTRFVWLMGADNLQQIPKWRNWTALFAETPIAVFRRRGYAAGKGRGRAANRFAKAWVPTRRSKKLALMTPPCWLVLDNPLNLLSATAIRRHSVR